MRLGEAIDKITINHKLQARATNLKTSCRLLVVSDKIKYVMVYDDGTFGEDVSIPYKTNNGEAIHWDVEYIQPLETKLTATITSPFTKLEIKQIVVNFSNKIEEAALKYLDDWDGDLVFDVVLRTKRKGV